MKKVKQYIATLLLAVAILAVLCVPAFAAMPVVDSCVGIAVKKSGNSWYTYKGNSRVNYTGVAQNKNGWWRVENGKVNFKANGIYHNDYGWWKCVGGKVNFKANGVYKNEYGWWAVEGGKVRFSYTGLKSNAYGVWYVEQGKVRFNYNGTVDGNIVENSKVVGRVAGPEPSDRVYALLDSMTLEQKIAQMCIVRPEALTGADNATTAGASAKATLQQYPVGGVILFSKNLTGASQAKSLIQNLQTYSSQVTGTGLLVAVDEEGGNVARCATKLGTTKFSPMLNYEGKGSATAYNNASTIARDIQQFGFNVNLAPVADIAPNYNKATEKRIYSRDYTIGSNLIYNAVKGYEDNGVAATLKHFPGLGSTTKDPHDTWTTIHKSPEKMRTQDYATFRAGIAAGADFVMVGHVVNTAVDNQTPASLSYYYVTQVLREELGFDGLVMTDSLEMGAITKYFGNGDAAVMAVQAGNDLLLMPKSLPTAVNAIKDAVYNGSISENQINESVLHILTQKEAMGLF